MTCIIGFVAPDKTVYVGGDSAGISGFRVTIRDDVKVFVRNKFVIGFTTSFRMGQLIQYDFYPPSHPEKMADHAYMVRKFVPAIRAAFKGGGYTKIEDNQESGGSFLVGYRGKLYEISDDFQVGIPSGGIAAVGAGADVALGAMYVLKDNPESPADLIRRALEVTAHLNASVRPPFVVRKIS